MLYKLNWWKHVKTGLVYFFSPHPLISNFQLKQSLGLNSLRTVYTNGELSQDLYSKNSAKFEGRCISHNSIFSWTCRLFHHKKKQAAKNFQRCNIQPKPESNILYYHSSSKAISLGSRCHLCSILQFVCHDYQFSFLSSKDKSQ